MLNPKVRLRVGHPHWQFWPIVAHFMDYYSLFWGPGVVSMVNEPCGAFTCRSMKLTIWANFWSVLCTITHHFGVPERFPLFTIPGVRLRLCRQHSQFWPILARFFDYYSLFSGNEAISIIVEPQGPLTCRSSTLAVLADFGPFHGLLLTVLGSRSGFHG